MEKKVLQSESIPEFQESIDNMSEESKCKVDEALRDAENGTKPVFAVRCYQIDFGNHLRCKIKVTDNGIEVEGAMNGWGDGVPLNEVVFVEVQ